MATMISSIWIAPVLTSANPEQDKASLPAFSQLENGLRFPVLQDHTDFPAESCSLLPKHPSQASLACTQVLVLVLTTCSENQRTT